jgi:spore coat protein CotF
MKVQLTQKERMLLEDLKSHEEICIIKYNNYANQTQCQELKQIFTNHAQKEQEHYNTINQMLSGQVPYMNNQQNQSSTATMGTQGSMKNAMTNEDDKVLCSDLLMTEKHVSNTYNTAIFEFANADARNALNHIQKEEQQHGEDIFKYMQKKNMYMTQ